jgi:hypothetical protein
MLLSKFWICIQNNSFYMIEELLLLEVNILKNLNLQISNLNREEECNEYLGFNFTIGTQSFKFRKAKITPKKCGQFVTLWKRNQNGNTEPFQYSDPYDFYIIATDYEERKGFFLFSKYSLRENKILTHIYDGKRGFRLYPDWDRPVSKQAIKTQIWQSAYFIDYTEDTQIPTLKFASLINSEFLQS